MFRNFGAVPAISYQKLLDQDSRPVPDHLRIDTAVFLGDHDIPVDRYIDPKFHELEKEKIWKKVWQVALREERIPNVGDADVYEINDISIILVRVAPDTIKGYYNACLHMGRSLVERPCNVSEIRCPYHGFTWHTDGKLKRIHSMWDFPQIDVRKFNLPEVKVARWGGFIFINMDPHCESLDAYLGDLNKHFEKYRPRGTLYRRARGEGPPRQLEDGARSFHGCLSCGRDASSSSDEHRR